MVANMDVDEDDDFYSPEEPAQSTEEQQPTEQQPQSADVKAEQEDEDLEEGEEEDEGSEGSDSVIFTYCSAPERLLIMFVGHRHHHGEEGRLQGCTSFVSYLPGVNYNY